MYNIDLSQNQNFCGFYALFNQRSLFNSLVDPQKILQAQF